MAASYWQRAMMNLCFGRICLQVDDALSSYCTFTNKQMWGKLLFTARFRLAQGDTTTAL